MNLFEVTGPPCALRNGLRGDCRTLNRCVRYSQRNCFRGRPLCKKENNIVYIFTMIHGYMEICHTYNVFISYSKIFCKLYTFDVIYHQWCYNSIDRKLRLYTWPPAYYISPVNCRSLVVWCSQPYDTTRGGNQSSQFDPMFTCDISADLLSIEFNKVPYPLISIIMNILFISVSISLTRLSEFGLSGILRYHDCIKSSPERRLSITLHWIRYSCFG